MLKTLITSSTTPQDFATHVVVCIKPSNTAKGTVNCGMSDSS